MDSDDFQNILTTVWTFSFLVERESRLLVSFGTSGVG